MGVLGWALSVSVALGADRFGLVPDWPRETESFRPLESFPMCRNETYRPLCDRASDFRGLMRKRLSLSASAGAGRAAVGSGTISVYARPPSWLVRGDGLGALASALGGWLRGPQSHWGAPARIARPGQVLGDLETAAGRCVGEGAARAKADYGAARLPEPEFKGLDDCKERVTPLVRRLKVSGTLSPPCGLGATKKVKKSVGVRDRLKKKLGMR